MIEIFIVQCNNIYRQDCTAHTGACLCSHSPMFPQPYVPSALCSLISKVFFFFPNPKPNPNSKPNPNLTLFGREGGLKGRNVCVREHRAEGT